MEVVAQDSGAEGMVQGVTEAQYRELNEFSLSEHSRHLATFANLRWNEKTSKRDDRYGRREHERERNLRLMIESVGY